ncbi:glycosyltransferase [uncultured Croceitalea sp.]|uniref:glycosyltransferase family 4 protein n=1 Tax=uncultured Croceitalea sp. TaxID=1798908 RepID=UPI003305F325
MKVLFCARHNFYTAPGGAQVQILKTKAHLEELGVTCDITISPYNVNFNLYDIVHLTDLTWVYDNMVYLKELDKQKFDGKKVLSTIYWPFDDYAANGAPRLQRFIFKLFGVNGFEFFKALAKFIAKKESIYLEGVKNSYISNQRRIASEMDWLLPNAELEMVALNNRLNLDLNNYSVVYNAIDTHVFDEIKKENRIIKEQNLITFVARIDPRKNQLNFLKSMIDTDYKICFIGSAGPNSKKYFKKLKILGEKRGNVEFVSHIPQEEVFKYMMKAKVNVLTSWVETPGLVSLEAAYADCNIVVAEKGSVKEYFKEYAYYCCTDDLEDIRTQTIEALKSPFKADFKEVIRTNFSWGKTAEETLKAYKKILNE